MDEKLLLVLGLSFIGSVAGLVGGVIFLVKKTWAEKLAVVAVPFAAGVLISVSMLNLIPEAVDNLGKSAYVYVLLAFFGSFVFEHYFVHLHHHDDHDMSLQSAAPLVVIGDTIHNFIDGVAIAAAYLTNPSFGLVVALSTFLHETPHEIGDFGVLMAAGKSRQATFWINMLSALATFPGALWVFFFLKGAYQPIGILLAISAGIFLYLGASDFLPELHRSNKNLSLWSRVLPVILGVIIMYGLSLILVEH